MKRLLISITAIAVIFISTGCETLKRVSKDIHSNISGLDRIAEVYDQNGNIIKTYEGKFDIEVNEYGNKIKFDINGKRILIYNATVVIEEKTQEDN